MRQPAWTSFEQEEKLPVPPVESGFKYSVPSMWGTLRVSEEADDAYKMRPVDDRRVIEGSSEDLLDLGEAPPFRTDVFVLSPGEYNAVFGEQPTALDGQVEPQGTTTLHPGGIALTLAFNKDTHSMQDDIVEDYTRLVNPWGGTALNDEELKALVSDTLSGTAGTYMAHTLCDTLKPMAQTGVAEYLRVAQGKETMRLFNRLGAASLGGVTTLLAGGALVGSPGFFAVAAGAYGVTSGMSLRRVVKDSVAKRNSTEQLIGAASSMHGLLVSLDVHATYCNGSGEELPPTFPII